MLSRKWVLPFRGRGGRAADQANHGETGVRHSAQRRQQHRRIQRARSGAKLISCKRHSPMFYLPPPPSVRTPRHGPNTVLCSPTGVTFPSGEMQQRLVRSLYEEANITPDQVEYIEAHGTGTKVSAVTKSPSTGGQPTVAACLLPHAGRRPTGSQRHRRCVLQVEEGASAHWLHQVQHGASRAGLWSGCHGEGENYTDPSTSPVHRQKI